VKIGRIEIVLAGNADQREQRIAPGVSQSGPHPMRGGHFADGTDRPIRRDPFAGGMGQQRGQPDPARALVDGGGLDGGDLMLAKALADDIQPAGQRSVAEGPIPLAGKRRADGGD